METEYENCIAEFRRGNGLNHLMTCINAHLCDDLCLIKNQTGFSICSNKRKMECPLVLLPTAFSTLKSRTYEKHEVTLCLLTEKGLDESKAVTVSCSQLKFIDWFYDKLALQIGVFIDTGQYQLLQRLIYPLCAQLTESVTYDFLGYSCDENRCYITGSEVIAVSQVSAKVSCGLIKYAWSYCPEFDVKVCGQFVMNTLFKILTFEKTFFLSSYAALSTWVSRLKLNGQEAPQFILVVLGKTGSGKTTVVKLYFQTSPCSQVNLNFESTSASIDALLEIYADRVLVIDDYHSDTAALSAKAEHIIRVTCDNGGFRRKMQGNQLHEADCYASPVITAEVPPFHSASSCARSVTVELSRNTINWEAVTACQQNQAYWPTVLAAYIKYSLVKGDELERLLESFRENRLRISQKRYLVHQRLIEAMAWQQAAYKSFLEFMLHIDAIDQEQFKEQLQKAETTVERYLQGVADSSISAEKHVIEAIQNLLLYKEVDIKPVCIKKNGRKTADVTPKTIAVRDNDGILILKERLIIILNSYFQKKNIDFRITEKAFLDILKDKDLLLPTIRDDGTRSVQRSLNGIRRSFIGVKKNETEKWLKIEK